MTHQELGEKQQKEVLSEYMELYQQPTLRDVAKETGLQLTRVFRLMNGSPMKLNEYLIFRKKNSDKLKVDCSFVALAKECEDQLSLSILEDWSRQLRRALKQKRIKQSNVKVIPNYHLA